MQAVSLKQNQFIYDSLSDPLNNNITSGMLKRFLSPKEKQHQENKSG